MTVFIIQNQNHVDVRDGQLKPKFDFSDAERFGTLHFVLPPAASPFRLELSLPQLKQELSEYSPRDFLLLTGSPVLLGLAVAIAADATGGHVNMLQWSGSKRQYVPVFARDIFPD